MPGYGKNTAEAYNRLWGRYAIACAKSIYNLYTITVAPQSKAILDLCCGTGHLLKYFLDQGFMATGLDLSEHMLAHAQNNCYSYVEQGHAQFLLTDVRSFQLPTQFDLVTATYDSLNHLESAEALKEVFVKVQRVLSAHGMFVFDLNTTRGLDDWNRVRVTDRDGYAVISRGFFDPSEGIARKKFSGFYRIGNGYYERFEEIIANIALPVSEVESMLRHVGFGHCYTADLSDLSTKIIDPEALDRVVFIVRH
jgi:SAM-dependent methyltransferase